MTTNNNGIDFRWGCDIEDKSRNGGTTIPGYVLRHYHELGVTAAQMMLITHLSAYHFNSANGQSRPSLKTIAELMGYKKDNGVRKMIKDLETASLVNVTRVPGRNSIYDFGELSRRCLALDKVSPSEGVPPESGRSVSPNLGDEDKRDKTKEKDFADTPSAVSAGEGKNLPDPNAEAPRSEAAPKPKQPHVAIIDGYLSGLDELGRKPIQANPYSRWGIIAGAIAAEGHTEERVRACVLWVYSEDNPETFWKEKKKPIPLELLAEIINTWSNEHPVNTAEPSEGLVFHGEPGFDPKFDQRFAGLDIIGTTLLRDKLMIEQLEKQFGGGKK